MYIDIGTSSMLCIMIIKLLQQGIKKCFWKSKSLAVLLQTFWTSFELPQSTVIMHFDTIDPVQALARPG